MKIFSTKYVLTRGIEEVEVMSPYQDGDIYRYSDSPGIATQFCPGEWHTDRAEAVKAAEKIRDRKVKSLERQIDKLQGMQF